MEPLDTDPVTAARVRDALARRALGEQWTAGGRALARERELARYLESRFPRLGHMILAGFEFHREAIRRAVTGGEDGFRIPLPAGVIIAGAGLPPPGLPLHSRAAAANPKARFVYSAPDERITDVNEEELASPEPDRVAAVTARSLDADAVLGAGPGAELRALGPVSVHVVLTPARWPPELAGRAVARYAELMPAGSTLCLSLVAGDPGAGGSELMDAASLAGGRGYHHSAADVARWIGEAGLVMHPGGVRPVRAFREAWAERYPVAPGIPGRVLGAAAVKPPDDER